MNIFIIRHGQTDWNIEKRVQGKADIELNETGKKQAKEVSTKLWQEKIDIIISSPLKRARQTAEIIGESIKCPVICREGISERDFGEFEGKHKDEFDFEEFWSYKQNLTCERAENIRDFFARVYNELDNIIKEYNGKNVLIVSHGGVSIPVKCYFEGMPESDTLILMGLHNCEVKKYEVN